MAQHIRKILWFASMLGKAACIAALLFAFGCSKGAIKKEGDFTKTWDCDRQADEAMKRHDYDAAIYLHERLLEKEPQNALALYHLGYTYGRTGHHLKEVSYYEKAIAFGFKRNHIFFNLGISSC